MAIAAAFIAGLSIGMSVRAAEAPRSVQEPAPAMGSAGFEQGVFPTSVAPGRTAAPAAAVTVPRGTASWYRAAGLVAAAGPDLRRWLGPGWRGERIRVVAGGRSVVVRIVDWCQCYRGEPRERLIDLGDEAFVELAPLAVGLVRVRVELLGREPRATPPATDR